MLGLNFSITLRRVLAALARAVDGLATQAGEALTTQGGDYLGWQ